VPDHVDETVALYKYWARFHHAIAQWLFERNNLSSGSGLPPLVTAIGGAGDYRYVLGDAFLVAPLLDPSGKRDVVLPAGSRWFDWWTNDAHEGGTTVAADFSADRAKIPLFVRAGSTVKLEVDDPENVLGLDGATHAVWPNDEPTIVVNVDVPNAVIRVRLDAAPSAVTGGDFTYDNAKKVLVVRATGPSVTITK